MPASHAQDAEITQFRCSSHDKARRPTKPRQELVARFLGEHFAPERFCAALPERDLEWQFKRTRARYVHPDIAPESWNAADAWYAQWRDRIVFVESAGFWWIEDPR